MVDTLAGGFAHAGEVEPNPLAVHLLRSAAERLGLAERVEVLHLSVAAETGGVEHVLTCPELGPHTTWRAAAQDALARCCVFFALIG